MAISRNYLQLQRQIADELGDRQDLLAPLSDSLDAQSPIQNAIQSAIAKWEREPFWFNELYSQGAFSTVAGQEYYTTTDVPAFANLVHIPQVRVLINSNRYTLNARTWQYIEEISVNPAEQSSFPTDYAYFAGTMRLYPTPNGGIPVTLMVNTRLDNLAADSDTNVWTTEGYDLIRSEAKRILAREVLFDDDVARRMDTVIDGEAFSGSKGYLYALKAESTRRGGGGKIRPTFF